MKQIEQWFYHVAGLAMMGVACAKHRLHGYTTPTPFSASDVEKSAEHARSIVAHWPDSLHRVGHKVKGHVLELGPGGTLGTGAILLGHGAQRYHALDAFPLAQDTPPSFYRDLVLADPRLSRDQKAAAISAIDAGHLAYTVDPTFRIDEAVGGRTFDTIVSCAAFEHFADVPATVAQMTRVANPGALAVISIDFQTHSRWVREADPNNIYRYSPLIYRALDFPGKPNRLRPDDYISAFERCGWKTLAFIPNRKLSLSYPNAVRAKVAKQFERAGAQMDVLDGTFVGQLAG